MYRQLTSEQRYTINVLLQKKMTLSFIAETIKVSVSTVFREIKRNSDAKGRYSAQVAERKTLRRKSSLPGNRSISPHVRGRVFGLIRTGQWSPEQVSGRLRSEEGVKVSKSTIYNWIKACPPHYKDSIHRHLRRGGRRLRKNGAAGKSLVPNRVSIDECSFKDYGAAVGDWEMDTIVGKDGKGVILTLVEKKSSFLIMEKLKTGKKALPLANAVVRRLKETGLPVRMIVTDNGMEFAAHELIARELNTFTSRTHIHHGRKEPLRTSTGL